MTDIGIIGGSGFYSLTEDGGEPVRFATPYGETEVTLYRENLAGRPVWFLPRHGREHAVPPHRIDYRANVWALREAGARQVFAVNAVGGIHPDMGPGALAVPDQILDYTWGREHTYFDGAGSLHNHIDFTWPYDAALRARLIESCAALGLPASPAGVYGCTQGPRLETAAEIVKLRRDGCDMVGMTGMPEAVLARELGIAYACIALVVNWAAGITEESISLEVIVRTLEEGAGRVREVLKGAVSISSW